MAEENGRLQVLGDGIEAAPHVQEAELQEEDEEQEQEMHPWEQHAGVILMPRYLYGSQAHRLLQDQRPPGFLITCSFRKTPLPFRLLIVNACHTSSLSTSILNRISFEMV